MYGLIQHTSLVKCLKFYTWSCVLSSDIWVLVLSSDEFNHIQTKYVSPCNHGHWTQPNHWSVLGLSSIHLTVHVSSYVY